MMTHSDFASSCPASDTLGRRQGRSNIGVFMLISLRTIANRTAAGSAITSAAVLALSLLGPASAADLGMRFKAPPLPLPIFSWTGFYLGGDVGSVSYTHL